MKKVFTQAPLPFMGQKRNFLKAFKTVLNAYPTNATYVDLFGGSGLLSHTVKAMYPNAKVVYNDFDNYSNRLNNIDNTNTLIGDLREILKDYPEDKIITGQHRESALNRIKKEETTHQVDYITLSSSLLFTMNCANSFEQLEKSTLYNCLRKSNYNADGYLDGIEVVRQDYKELFAKYKDCPNVVFLVDPPYLSTDVSTYKGYWKLVDYLNVLNVLKGSNYLYFTSNKSQIIELCEWLETQSATLNPIFGAKIECVQGKAIYTTKYTDMMIYKQVS